MLKVKYLIIGAGVSGLGFANFIRDDNFLVLEKESEPGGYCRTIYKDGFIWDFAGHFFHFANPELKEFFNLKINKEDVIYKKKITKIYYKGEYIDYPFQKNIHQLSKEEFIDCLYDLSIKEEKDRYLSFQDMLYGKFGKSITEKFLKPYNEKLYACDLNDLDADAMGRFFPYANLKDVIQNMKLEEDNSYNQEFLYPKKGAITFINALLEGLDPEKILLNQEITQIDIDKKVAKTKDLEIQYEYLVNSSPFDRLIEMIDKNEYSRNKTKYTYNKVLVLNLGFNKKSAIKNMHWVYVPDKETNFYRIGFYDNILDSDRLSMYIEIGYRSNEEVNIDYQLNLTLKNLKRMGIIDNHELVAYSSIVMIPAYIHISEEGQRVKENKKKELTQKNIYTIGRYGDWKYCSIEDSITDAINLAKVFNNK
ncbi:LPS biosynthesis protein [Paenibacillus sp. Soil766]|nr:LPS biosynthesis protein [Paenibacillus sp. Soil766]